jgi:hypothetical protein
MILVDFSQIFVASLHVQLKQSKNDPARIVERRWLAEQDGEYSEDVGEVNPPMLRHMALSSIRRINKGFRKRFGRLVIATDNVNYWRKSAFKYYKANRKKDRDDSGIDWSLVFRILNDLRTEIKENFPYKVMDVPGAEADDVIGVLAKHHHEQEGILIVSGDHDFEQLQKYSNVHQYGPVQDKLLITTDPAKFLFEHILHGDKGDGVPNFLSADDSLVNNIKQKSIYQAKVNVWYGQPIETFCPDESTKSNYYRNKKLIDLDEIPASVETAILDEFNIPVIGSREMIYGYLIKNRMKNLLSEIKDF